VKPSFFFEESNSARPWIEYGKFLWETTPSAFNALECIEVGLELLKFEISTGQLELSAANGLFKTLIDLTLIDDPDLSERLRELFDEGDLLAERLITRSPDWQFVSGFSGAALYVLLRHRLSRTCPKALSHYVSRLEDFSVRSERGVSWENHLYDAPGFDSGVVYGLAHGTAAPINLLSRIVHKYGNVKGARSLLSDATRCLEAMAASYDFLFPYYATKNRDARKIPQAWCYGNPGIAYTLFLSGKVLRRPQASLVAQKLVQASLATSLIKPEPGLCHGAAGLSLLFRRMHELHPMPALRNQSRKLLRSALSSAGHRQLRSDESFLIGELGVIYMYLEALGKAPRAWDATLLTHHLDA
jgi:lantibiotic modifying enzyme